MLDTSAPLRRSAPERLPGQRAADLARLRFPPAPSPGQTSLLRRQHFLDVVERDVRERLGARSSLPIKQLAQMVFESAGAELSVRRVAASAGIAVDTASAYLEACETAYLLFGCPFFALSERKRASMNRKFYPVDPGLRRVVIAPTGELRAPGNHVGQSGAVLEAVGPDGMRAYATRTQKPLKNVCIPS